VTSPSVFDVILSGYDVPSEVERVEGVGDRVVVTESAETMRVVAEPAYARAWSVKAPATFSLAERTHAVAIIEGSPLAPAALLVSFRFPGPGQDLRYGLETHPRADLRDLLDRFAHEGFGARPATSAILGSSLAMETVRGQVAKVARYAEVPVLILGETGTGKEMVAHALHESGATADRPFTAINCAAIPAALFEAELFGHASGAFSGAAKSRVGLLEEAGEGTVFLDEVGDLPVELQPKLLRVLEERRFRRVGSNEDLPLRARVVSATHLDASRAQTLRRDLFYRLSGFTISLPPLRHRPEDVSEIAHAFLARFARRHRAIPCQLSIGGEAELARHRWPGNVRELRTVVERAAILAESTTISAAEIATAIEHAQTQHPDHHRRTSLPPQSPVASNAGAGVIAVAAERATIPEITRAMLIAAYEASGKNIAETARRLGLARTTVRDRLSRLGVL